MSGPTVNTMRGLNDVPKLQVCITLDSDLTTKFVITEAKLNIQQSEQLIYVDVGSSIEHWIKPDACDDRVEYATLNHQNDLLKSQPEHDFSTVGESHESCQWYYFNTIMIVMFSDRQLDLDSLLIQLRTQVTPKWYQFGLALGVDKDVLNKYSKCPQEESMVKLADYWLRNSYTKPTWRDVAEALKKIGFVSLAEDILHMYKTG